MPLLSGHLFTKRDKKENKITQEHIVMITRSLAEGIEGLLFPLDFPPSTKKKTIFLGLTTLCCGARMSLFGYFRQPVHTNITKEESSEPFKKSWRAGG